MGFSFETRNEKEKSAIKKFGKRLIISIVSLCVFVFLMNGVAYYYLLNNEYWHYFGGFVVFMKYLTPIFIVLLFYFVRMLKSRDFAVDVLKGSSKITRDTEMLTRINEQGGI